MRCESDTHDVCVCVCVPCIQGCSVHPNAHATQDTTYRAVPPSLAGFRLGLPVGSYILISKQGSLPYSSLPPHVPYLALPCLAFLHNNAHLGIGRLAGVRSKRAFAGSTQTRKAPSPIYRRITRTYLRRARDIVYILRSIYLRYFTSLVFTTSLEAKLFSGLVG